MAFLGFVLCMVIFSYLHADKIEMLPITEDQVNKCLQVSSASLDEFRNFNVEDKPSKTLLCMAKCVMQETGIMDNTGKLLREEIAKYKLDLPPSKEKKALECTNVVQRIDDCYDLEAYRQCIIS